MTAISTGGALRLNTPLWLFRDSRYFGKIACGHRLSPIPDAAHPPHQAYSVDGIMQGGLPLIVAIQEVAVQLIEIGRVAPAIVVGYDCKEDLPKRLTRMGKLGGLRISSSWGGEARAMIEALQALSDRADVQVSDARTRYPHGRPKEDVRLCEAGRDDGIHLKICGIKIKKDHFFREEKDSESGSTVAVGCGGLIVIALGLLFLLHAL